MSPARVETNAEPPPAAAAKKKPQKLAVPRPPDPPPKPHWIARIVPAPALLALLWPAILVIGGYVAWQRWGAERVGQQYYRLQPASVSITPPPPYIHSDIVAKVFATHQLEKTSLLDQLAAAVIGEAFQTHPWVSDVVRVEKRADGVDVRLRYRRPIAMVRVQSEHPDVSGEGLFVVDAQGVLLPTSDFSISDQTKYFQVEIEGTYPKAGDGASYGDARVLAAARLAAFLEPQREAMQWAAIKLTNPRLWNPRPTFNEAWVFAVIRRDGSEFIWGSAPGDELQDEPTAEEKLESLLRAPRIATDLRHDVPALQ